LNNSLKEAILKKFLDAQDRLVIQSSDLSLESIANMVGSDAIDISPNYQRRERWTVEKQSALIESFLLNIPVPPIYLAEDEYGKYSVIDGKQRITAIYKFIKEGLKLSTLENFKALEGLSFENLPTPLNNALKIRPYIRVVTILKQSDQDLKYEVFTRLNTGGENLLPQEIRNVAYRGKMNDLIFDLAGNRFLRSQLKITSNSAKAYKEMMDAEYVLRFFTLYEKWESFPGNMKEAMDDFMKDHQNPNEGKLKFYRKLYNDTMLTCQEIWGKWAFMRPEGHSYRNQLVQGVYDVQMVPISFFINNKHAQLLKHSKQIKTAFLKEYNGNRSFQNSIRQFTSNTERVKYRMSVMRQLIQKVIS
jgi:hypothetical protein